MEVGGGHAIGLVDVWLKPSWTLPFHPEAFIDISFILLSGNKPIMPFPTILEKLNNCD